jgi:hypothetical protein
MHHERCQPGGNGASRALAPKQRFMRVLTAPGAPQ